MLKITELKHLYLIGNALKLRYVNLRSLKIP